MSTTTVVTAKNEVALGLAVPPHTPHAISVSLPKWRDNVGYEEGEKRVIDSMVSGYPRFFIHLSIQKLARVCEQKFAVEGESAMLFPTQKIANFCRSFIQDRSEKEDRAASARLVCLLICPEDKQNQGRPDGSGPLSSACVNVHIVLFPTAVFPIAKQFWQHTGMGISSRLAEYCLSILAAEIASTPTPSPVATRFPPINRHYAVQKPNSKLLSTKLSCPPSSPQVENLSVDHTVYLEERYGRNLPIAAAAAAKRALRRRISGVLVRDSPYDCQGEPCAGDQNLPLGPSSRGVAEVSENDVFLFPTGMASIWNAHNIALSVLPPAKSVCFGFPYTDTLKILQKWGPGCHFLGHGLDSDIDKLETILEDESRRDPNTPPVLALFTEFPSNPLLRSANLPRLRGLADKYDFLIVVDETIGNFVNVEVLKYADIVVSSLTKVFSGYSNVMGGSLCLNPQGRHYAKLRSHMDASFEDNYFDEDAIYMERNSRDFKSRIKVIDNNAETVCEFLRAQIHKPSSVIKEVYYPKYVTRENFEQCRIKSEAGELQGGFGGLFSVTFTSKVASHAFFDALSCYKGPSLGTNFTLASPFVILAHFTELEWAAQYGVEQDLVRVSVGMEETSDLVASFEKALRAAEAAVAQ